MLHTPSALYFSLCIWVEYSTGYLWHNVAGTFLYMPMGVMHINALQQGQAFHTSRHLAIVWKVFCSSGWPCHLMHSCLSTRKRGALTFSDFTALCLDQFIKSVMTAVSKHTHRLFISPELLTYGVISAQTVVTSLLFPCFKGSFSVMEPSVVWWYSMKKKWPVTSLVSIQTH